MNPWDSQHKKTLSLALKKLEELESKVPSQWSSDGISEICSHNPNLFKADKELDKRLDLKHLKKVLKSVDIHKLWCTWFSNIDLIQQPSTNTSIIHAQSNSDPNKDVTFVEKILEKKQCLYYLASSKSQEYFLAFKIQNKFSSTHITVYCQWEAQIDSMHTNSMLGDLVRLTSLPYVSLYDRLQIVSLKYKDFYTLEIEYNYTNTDTSTVTNMAHSAASSAVSIKSNRWHSGSWNQERSAHAKMLSPSPSLYAHQFRPSASCPDNNSLLHSWDSIGKEGKLDGLNVKIAGPTNVHVSLPYHDDWTEKFIQLYVHCYKTKSSHILQLSHPKQLIRHLKENASNDNLSVKVVLEMSQESLLTVNNTAWPVENLCYDSESESINSDDTDNTDSENSKCDSVSSEKREISNEDEDIFVDGMEELEETNCITSSERILSTSLPESNRLIHSQNQVVSSSMSLQSVRPKTATLPRKESPKFQQTKIYVSAPDLIERKKDLPKVVIPDSDPVALQKAYHLFTQYVKPDVLQLVATVQSSCRDNGYVTIKKLDVPEHPMGAFLADSTWKDCSIWDVKAVVESAGARKIWDTTFESNTFLHFVTPSSSIWHTRFKGAWPVSSRDYVCFQGQYTSSNLIDLVSTSCIGDSYQHKCLPKEISGYSRATMDVAGWRLERINQTSVSVKNVLMTHFSTWVINYFTSRYIEQSLASIHIAREYLDLYGAPPSLESLTNAILVNLKLDHERKTWRCEYSRRTESDSNEKGMKAIPSASTISYIRIDMRRWALVAKNKYSIIIDPPPSRVHATKRNQDSYGVWLAIEHDEVFIIPFHGKILAIIKPDETFVKELDKNSECRIFVNGSPITIEQESRLSDVLLENDSTQVLPKSPTNEAPNSSFFSEGDSLEKAVDEMSVTPKKHAHAALNFLKQVDEQFGWNPVSDKNGIKISKRPGTRSKKKENESPFISAASKKSWSLEVPEPFTIYKASKVIEDYSSEEVVSVVSDVESTRKAYDDTVDDMSVIRHMEPGYKIIRQSIKSIFPLKSREVYSCSCLARMVSSTGTGRTVYFESSIPDFPALPTKKPRGNLFMSAWIIEPIDPYTTVENHPIPSTRVIYVAALDLGASVPSYVSNLLVNNWFPKKIQAVQSYLKTNGAPPFISEPIISLTIDPTDAPFQWQSISHSYDKNSRHYQVESTLKVFSLESTTAKRSILLSKRSSPGAANKSGGEADSMNVPRSSHLLPADKSVRRGSLSAILPKKRVVAVEAKERSISSSRAFTFLQTTLDLRSFTNGYTILVQLFNVTSKKKKVDISNELIIQVSEPVLTVAKGESAKHSIHVKTLRLSPSILPAVYEFEFSLNPILEQDIKTQFADPQMLCSDRGGYDNKSTVIVNGSRIAIGCENKVKPCVVDEGKAGESSYSAESLKTIESLGSDYKEICSIRESCQSSPENESDDISTLSHYASGSVVATALGNVSAGVNNIGARMMFPFRSSSSRAIVSHSQHEDSLPSRAALKKASNIRSLELNKHPEALKRKIRFMYIQW
ncbi:hypothetical protein BY458DRAFT_508788 [Sporodiniella umbellata]|nr:hypothetical protein BY458DRAFT_508788 [Sporodiniella umbellata]